MLLHQLVTFLRQRDSAVLSAFRSMFEAKVDDSASLAHHLLALIGGLEEQWLRTPDELDLISE